ncbi:crossover junction endodeoxyribonuclease RuvC [Nesterenkonia aerolata]|uniref:Crossover junction endodeoxyribonuclease RuvC n=1 Tax=Nesterenkonia aerolata TaxID=3074079 RepID=A0ABU2DS07_9MICC|nr:crossover junction endodeoxyribonuclease RuvC [Nesterenkonia sp. LY-0111]MDR8019151.1 crossover junction endodeoxyribonuclease RuvC [Nesterenkonia sp. LY-0111]
MAGSAPGVSSTGSTGSTGGTGGTGSTGPRGATAGSAKNSLVDQRILGVDPGLTRCGFAVVEMRRDRSGESIHVEVTGTRSHQDLAERILAIQRAAEALLDTYAPDVLAIERVFAQNNAPTVVGTAQASGVVIAAAAARGIPVAWHTPSEVKAAVTDDGRAQKDAVARMVQRILRLPSLPTPVDATDAYAVAICHAWRAGIGTRHDMSADTSTHQGAKTSWQRAAEAQESSLTPAQQAWRAAERRSRAPGGRVGGRGAGGRR